MSYVYSEQRPNLFTESGVTMLLKVRKKVDHLLTEAGAVRIQEVMTKITGDSRLMLAAFDYLVENGELREISEPGCAGQHRVFVRAS